MIIDVVYKWNGRVRYITVTTVPSLTYRTFRILYRVNVFGRWLLRPRLLQFAQFHRLGNDRTQALVGLDQAELMFYVPNWKYLQQQNREGKINGKVTG